MTSGCKYPPHVALEKLEAFCAYQERSTSEIKRKLNEWGIGSDDSQEIIDKLNSKGFVDDKRFAFSFVSGKYRIKKWGRVKLRFELRQKGINDSLMKEALLSIDPEIYYSNLLDLATRKWRETKGKDKWDKKSKVMRYLASKGYESDLINDAIKQQSEE